MKQVLQDLGSGATEVADVPAPAAGPGRLLIRTRCSLVSAGTERMLVEFGRAGLIAKARQQPDKVREVLDKMRTDGVVATIEAVRAKLDQPLAMGYSNAGVVVEVGAGVRGFAVGDRVASNGKHAEVVSVPVNLCARVPDAVDDDAAAFTTVGAIALQGVRLAQPGLGECVVVIGLGLIGLITVQLLRAQGCRVLGVDFDRARLDLAAGFGAEVVGLADGTDPVSAATSFSRGRGVDAVLVTAATKSSEPMRQAARMCRKRGRIVLVGVAGLELARADFYEKELTFQVSCSYGPGRYDPDYEERGHDYPVGFVRWTEQRNFEAVLDLMAAGALDVAPLITHRFSIGAAGEAYALIAGREPSLGVLLTYPESAEALARTVALPGAQAPGDAPRLAVVGSGNYGARVLMPAFRAAGARFASIASASGVSGLYAARKFGAAETTTEADRVSTRPDVDAVVIATRHDTHAQYVCDALAAGKSVFVEKPLALVTEDLARIAHAYEHARERDARVKLMVGFNRRFAPQVVHAKRLLETVHEPKCVVITVNAGAIPPEHWTQHPSTGGGRLIGEGCHFVDAIRHLVGAPIAGFDVTGAHGGSGDRFTLTLRMGDGSTGTLHYFANGHKSYPKERIEVFCAGRVLAIDNFRRMRGHGWPGFRRLNLWRQDKGQRACAAAFVDAIRADRPSPIPFAELIEVSQVCIDAVRALAR